MTHDISRQTALDIARHGVLPWWRFHAEPMDYTADPSWYAGPV